MADRPAAIHIEIDNPPGHVAFNAQYMSLKELKDFDGRCCGLPAGMHNSEVVEEAPKVVYDSYSVFSEPTSCNSSSYRYLGRILCLWVSYKDTGPAGDPAKAERCRTITKTRGPASSPIHRAHATNASEANNRSGPFHLR